MDLTSLYALGLQAVAVLALIYLVAMLGARAVARDPPDEPGANGPKSHAYNAAASR